MGKVRASVIGDESLEKKQHEKAEKRRAAKKVTEGHTETEVEVREKRREAKAVAKGEEKKETKEIVKEVEILEADVQSPAQTEPAASAKSSSPLRHSSSEASEPKKKKAPRGKKYLASAKLVDKSKLYKVAEAIELLDKTHLGKFDETVELHINTLTPGISGQMTLPHGTGKQTRVAVLNPTANPAEATALLKEIESGKISFDILVATPDAMAKLAKVAKVLGPKGLMPNPKNGTITPKPDEVAKKFAEGQMYFKTEAKAPIIHLTIGKLSFGKDKLSENIATALSAIKSENIKNVTLKSTMSPGIKLQIGK